MTSSSPAPSSNLKAAKALIESGWTQGTSARDKDDKLVSPWNENAVCYCTMGALDKVIHANGDQYSQFQLSIGYIRTQIPVGMRVAEWNDAENRTKEEVLAVFDAAIQKAEEDERKQQEG